MAQVKENYAHSGDFQVYIPKNSTNITSGDVVVMPRRNDPKSRAWLGALNRISPISAATHAQYMVGVCDSDFTTNTVGATLYAAATSNQALPVYKRGVFKLAIVDTSGSAGDVVSWSSGGTGVQLFKIDNNQPSMAIGILEKNFSGATANDTQYVRLCEKETNGIDLMWWLENRVVEGCHMHSASGAGTVSSQIMVGITAVATGTEENIVLIKGKRFVIARETNLAVGTEIGGAPEVVKFRAVVARSGGFACRTASSVKTLTGQTWSGSKVTAGLFVVSDLTSEEVVIGYVVAWSSTARGYRASQLLHLDGPSRIPRFGSWSV